MSVIGPERLTRVVDGAAVENGFVDRSESTIAFDDGTRTFTISPTGASFDFFSDGQRYTKSAPETVVLPDIEGLQFVYYDETGTLVSNVGFFPDIITQFAIVAAIYWDADNDEAIIFEDERHGREMDSQTHIYNHLTLGTRYQEGLALTGILVDESGDDDAHAQVGVTDGVIWDEDLQLTITNGSPQTLSPAASIPVFYRDGLTAWRKAAAGVAPVVTTGSGRAAWNENVGGTWQLTEATNNDFVLVHLYATGDVNHPIIAIMGQGEYNNVFAARDAASVELAGLQFSQLDELVPEFLPIATMIYQTGNGYDNAVKSRVRSTDDADYIDWRTSGVVGVSSASVSPVQEAPIDGRTYARRDGLWSAVNGVQSLAPPGTTQEIDFETGDIHELDLDSASGDVTVSLANAQAGSTYVVKVIQGATARNLIWPASVKWQGGGAPTISTDDDAVDLVTLFFDGTDYYASIGQGW